MKQSKLRIILAGVTAVIVLAVSCSKSFLDKNPIGSLDQNTLANKAGVEGLLIGAYSLLDGYGGAGGGWLLPLTALVATPSLSARPLSYGSQENVE